VPVSLVTAQMGRKEEECRPNPFATTGENVFANLPDEIDIRLQILLELCFNLLKVFSDQDNSSKH